MEHASVNYVDIAVLIVLLLSGILAFVRGFVREVVAMLVWIGAAVIAAKFYPTLKPWMHHHIKNEMGADAATALALYCGSLLFLIPLGMLISSFVKGKTLTSIDRSFGFVFGLVRGLLVMSVIYIGLIFVWKEPDHQPEWLTSAKTRPVLAYGSELIKSLVPKDVQEKVDTDAVPPKSAAEQAIEAARQLQKLSIPAPTAHEGQPPAYGEDMRSGLDKLIQEKVKQ